MLDSAPRVRPSPGPPPVRRAHLGTASASAFAGRLDGGQVDETDPWAPDPVLDGAAIAAEEGAAAEAAAALQESGFGSALHTALTELGRISDDPVPVYAEPLPPSPGSENLTRGQVGRPDRARTEGPDWPAAEPVRVGSRRGGTAGWAATVGDWWTARWRDLFPGMVVAALIVVAFAVVLVSGGRHGDTSHLDSRPIPVDPSTTIPGLFTTATVPPGDTPPSDQAAPPATTAGPVANESPATTKASSTDSSAPAPTAKQPTAVTPGPTAPPNTSPPATEPPVTEPPVTEPPTTSPPDTTTIPDPPPSTPDICDLRPTHCTP